MSMDFSHRIHVNGAAAGSLATTYERQVHDNLLSIMMFRTGREVIRAIDATHRRLVIVPRRQLDQNAVAHPLNWRAATVAGEEVRDGAGQHRAAWGYGTGNGSSCILRFTPWLFPAELLPRWDAVAMRTWQAATGSQPVSAGLEMDEVLLHEMVHALEQMTGRQSDRRLGNGFDTVAEFDAILVVNLFIRERNRPARMNHQGFVSAPGQQSIMPNPQQFWDQVRSFVQRQRDLARNLASVPVTGNPFRDRRSVMAA